jgi:hypothetical protein
VKVSGPLVKVRGQPLSDGSFVCVLTFFGFGESGSDVFGLGVFGSDCRAMAAVQRRENRNTKVQNRDNPPPFAGLRIRMTNLQRTHTCALQSFVALCGYCLSPLMDYLRFCLQPIVLVVPLLSSAQLKYFVGTTADLLLKLQSRFSCLSYRRIRFCG